MPNPIAAPPLLRFLDRTSDIYRGKADEIREAASRWLALIPATFPHYTRHTVEHSDELVRQMSKLLFVDDAGKSPVVDLSPMEAFILVASAYFHDAGMVVSDTDKARILRSEAWANWVSEGNPGHERYLAVQGFGETAATNSTEARFLADVQLRHLLIPA